ncbi:hypothetical protein [Elizabethkingia anophelis]|uniref:hypothetical protein n=1 Tax=Elizabethkingia anophelis TaxID=1117645 RepID=UPI001318116D|nr:hypothetical protein [Elizabethkingia anophelis]BBQ07969.1 hypothetical protein JUNP353_2540 [Elizabethkingia anophelis]
MRETVKNKFVKNVKGLKIHFTPSTEEEQSYLIKLEELINQKRHGDWELVSEKLNLPARTVEKAFIRVYSKNHFEVVEALEQVIQERKNRLTN